MIVLKTLAHTAEDFGRLFPSLEHSIPEITSSLKTFAHKSHDDDLFVGSLCNVVAGVATGALPQENVGDVLGSAISERLGVPVFFAKDKFEQIEATFQLSQWNGAMAWRYVQVCARSGFPTRA